jgi:hypothetical protein
MMAVANITTLKLAAMENSLESIVTPTSANGKRLLMGNMNVLGSVPMSVGRYFTVQYYLIYFNVY